MNLVKIGILGGIFLLLNILLIYLERAALQIGQQNTNRAQKMSPYQYGGQSDERAVFEATIDYVGKKQTVVGQVKNMLLQNRNLSRLLPRSFQGPFLDKLVLIIIADAVKIMKENKLLIDLNGDRIANFYQKLSTMITSPNEASAIELKNIFESILSSPDYLEFIRRIWMDSNLYRLLYETMRVETRNLTILANNLSTNLVKNVERFPVRDESNEFNRLWENMAKTLTLKPSLPPVPMIQTVEVEEEY